jgi:zinc transport system substrate-binding protein
MFKKTGLFVLLMALSITWGTESHSKEPGEGAGVSKRSIIASDTILSGMVNALLPEDRYSVQAILPPGQCPGHYDIKLSDVEKTKKADLIVSFRRMPFVNRSALGGVPQLVVDARGCNWMVPDSYVNGLCVVAEGLSERFPEDGDEIMNRLDGQIQRVKDAGEALLAKIRNAGFFGKPVIASSMQKQPIEWMGFRVVGEYGRPEAMSAREVVQLSRAGKDLHVVMVVDNVQSGADAGKGIADTLGVPRVVLTNFPSEGGYLATLEANVTAVLSAVGGK